MQASPWAHRPSDLLPDRRGMQAAASAARRAGGEPRIERGERRAPSMAQARLEEPSKPPSSEGCAKPAPRSPLRRPGKKPGNPGKNLTPVPGPDAIVSPIPLRCGWSMAPPTTPTNYSHQLLPQRSLLLPQRSLGVDQPRPTYDLQVTRQEGRGFAPWPTTRLGGPPLSFRPGPLPLPSPTRARARTRSHLQRPRPWHTLPWAWHLQLHRGPPPTTSAPTEAVLFPITVRGINGIAAVGGAAWCRSLCSN